MAKGNCQRQQPKIMGKSNSKKQQLKTTAKGTLFKKISVKSNGQKP